MIELSLEEIEYFMKDAKPNELKDEGILKSIQVLLPKVEGKNNLALVSKIQASIVKIQEI
jgi:hypothetical protein